MKIYVEKKNFRAKEGNVIPYFSIYVDLGYRKQKLAMKINELAEILDVPVSVFHNSLEIDKPVSFATLNVDIDKDFLKEV